MKILRYVLSFRKLRTCNWIHKGDVPPKDYLLTPCSRVLLEKLIGLQLFKKFPAFYGTRRFITAFTSARHLSLSWAISIQSTPPHPTSWRSILILSSHLCLGLPSRPFPSGFPTKTLYTPLLSPIRATRPAHLILHDFVTRTILVEEYRSLTSSLCSSLHYLVHIYIYIRVCVCMCVCDLFRDEPRDVTWRVVPTFTRHSTETLYLSTISSTSRL